MEVCPSALSRRWRYVPSPPNSGKHSSLRSFGDPRWRCSPAALQLEREYGPRCVTDGIDPLGRYTKLKEPSSSRAMGSHLPGQEHDRRYILNEALCSMLRRGFLG